jgi:ABC-type multidrug transport system fused ATPase/permease subunit
MENSTSTIFELYDSYLFIGSYVFFGLALLIVLFHEIKVLSVSNEKDRYDYVNHYELKYFWYAIIALIGGIALFFSAYVTPMVPVDTTMKYYVSVFFVAGIVVIFYYLLSSLVNILYPRFLEGRLSRIRNKPRKSSSGNLMRKLSSEEGSVHLEAQQAVEHVSEIHSIEYDVWLDEKTGEKRVEKYMAFEHAEKCGECGYYTMRIRTEEIERKPTQTEDGLLAKHYRCSYCNHREAKEVVIAALSSNS